MFPSIQPIGLEAQFLGDDPSRLAALEPVRNRLTFECFIELTTDCIPAVTAGEQLEFRLSMAGFSSGQNAETAYSTTTTYAGGSTTEGGTVIPGSVDYKTFVQ